MPGPHTLSDEFDEKVSEAIRIACHGNLLGKDFGDLSNFLYENSPLCRQVAAQGEGADLGAILEEHKVHLTQEDLDRIFDPDYLKPAGANQIERECTVHTPGYPSGVDFLCNKTRSRLAADNMPMSQAEYDHVSAYCKDEPTQDGCIERWVDEEWVKKGTRRLPVRGLSLDDTMVNTRTSPAFPGGAEQRSVDLDALMAKPRAFEPASNAAYNDTPGTLLTSDRGTDSGQGSTTGSLSFDNIHAARETIRIDGIKANLVAISESIVSRCECAVEQTSCFDGYDFDYSQLNEYLAQADAAFEGQHDQLCIDWYGRSDGTVPDNEDVLNQHIRDGKAILASLEDLDTRFANLNQALRNKETEITWAREAEQDQGGFNLGKFAGLATGTLIGASMGGLGETETLNMLAGAALDSMGGVEGTSNLDASIAGMTAVHAEVGNGLDGMQAQSPQMSSAATQSASSGKINASTFSLPGDEGGEQVSAASAWPGDGERVEPQGDSAVGAYVASQRWKTCVVLAPNGNAYYKVQSLQNWRDPHSNYVWNQPEMSGTWVMTGDRVTVDVAGEAVDPATGASEAKHHRFTVTLAANRLGDANKVGEGLGACR